MRGSKNSQSKTKNGASRTFVVCNENAVIGYYCIAVGAVSRTESSGKVRGNMPERVPVMILGRLAVDLEWQGRQIGVGLLKDANLPTLAVSEQAGILRNIGSHPLFGGKAVLVRQRFHESPVIDRSHRLRQ